MYKLHFGDWMVKSNLEIAQKPPCCQYTVRSRYKKNGLATMKWQLWVVTSSHMNTVLYSQIQVMQFQDCLGSTVRRNIQTQHF